MKKIISLLLIVVMIISCFALTSCDCKHEWDMNSGKCKKCGEECKHTFNEKGRCTNCKFLCLHKNHDQFTRICADCGVETLHNFEDKTCVDCGKKTMFLDNDVPLEYEKPNDKKGSIGTFTYNTYAYAVEAAAGVEKGTIAIEKQARVYLPYGYDENKQYNVLYLMHGGDQNMNTWFFLENYYEQGRAKYDNVNMMDNLFATGEVQPFIIVTPTFYAPAPEGSEYSKYNESEDIGTYQIRNWRYELKDLVKAFENTYATYAKGDVSDENLIATRGHRAYAGLSMGARTSFASIFCGCLDFVGYIGSLSGSNVTAGEDNADLSMEWVRKAFNEDFKEYSPLYWYHGEGTKDDRYETHKEVYYRMLEEFPDRLKELDNTELVIKKDFAHDMKNWHIDLFNISHVFFTKG